MKRDTEKGYNRMVNQMIDYINSHLQEPLSLDSLAEKMNVSPYHFHRIMRAFLNEPLTSYIKRQRLQRAVMYLQMQKLNLTEVAEKVGYETPQSFSKAFKQHFGVSPKRFIEGLTAHTEISQDKPLELNISQKLTEEPSFNLVYVRIISKYGDEKPYIEGWNTLGSFLREKNLLYPGMRSIGISFDDPHITQEDKCRFYACATVNREVKAEGRIGVMQIEGGRFSVYTYKGDYSGLQKVYDYIYSHLDCELRNTLSYEEYVNNPANTKGEDLITKIYIPVV